jgi:hypothetical protein
MTGHCRLARLRISPSPDSHQARSQSVAWFDGTLPQNKIRLWFQSPVGEPIVAHKLPDVFEWVEFGAFRRQRNDGDVCRHDERQHPWWMLFSDLTESGEALDLGELASSRRLARRE